MPLSTRNETGVSDRRQSNAGHLSMAYFTDLKSVRPSGKKLLPTPAIDNCLC